MRGRPESKGVSLAISAAPQLAGIVPKEGKTDLVAAAVLAALEAALDALQVPALVVGHRSEIVCSNAAARALVGGVNCVTHWVISADGQGSPGWEVTPIGRSGPGAWSLAVLRESYVSPPRPLELTKRQREVLDLIVRGLTNTGIADALGIRLGTVEFHVSAIFDKVGVNSRSALIATVMGR
jgi:DNA-binding NarL/FixJ family response regulator